MVLVRMSRLVYNIKRIEGEKMKNIYPVKMSPVFKDYIWGGNKLKTLYQKNSPYEITAESWEVAVHQDGNSIAQNGEFKGMNIAQIYDILGQDLVGENNAQKSFPLMLKLIDAKDNLSVQVHPDDIYANKNENGQLGKTEMWYIIDAEPNAQLIFGFNRNITKDEFESAIKENKLKDILNYVDVKKGDSFFIKSGTVHAIGKGILLAEIQQNSNLTYRVFDWNRVGADGKLRPLHIDKALDVSNLNSSLGTDKTVPLKYENEDFIKNFLCFSKNFVAEEITVKKSYFEKLNNNSFKIILFLSDGEINGIKAQNGDSFLIPAKMPNIEINKNCKFLKFYVADFEKEFKPSLKKLNFSDTQINSIVNNC